MFRCDCFYWYSRLQELEPVEPEPFSLPAPLPDWPQGSSGFATGRISLGELEVAKITSFQSIWSCNLLHRKKKGVTVTFYKPVGIPAGFFCLGHYCQSNDQKLRGFVLVARDTASEKPDYGNQRGEDIFPALAKPLNYSLVWSAESQHGKCGYFWLPNPPTGYKATGFIVTDTPYQPSTGEVRCVRADLTESCEQWRSQTFNPMVSRIVMAPWCPGTPCGSPGSATGCEACDLVVDAESNTTECSFRVWNTRPCRRGMMKRGVSVGTFFCSTYFTGDHELETACLKNLDPALNAMPTLDQVHALIKHYGPTVFFHPDDLYMPSSVSWFFNNGACLFECGKLKGERIDSRGSNLPSGGSNDGKFWIDLPDNEDKRNYLKYGNLESAELYVHVKPAVGGSFTDIVMWVFCPFNGPATLKVGLANIELNRIGEHVSDWEHFTLRVSNFSGELWNVYFSQHSGGEWVDASNLEYIEGNRPVVYSSKSGHASFAHPGAYLQGSSKLGMGVRNDAAKSDFFVDSSIKYKIVSAEYLGDDVEEPCWLQYMREWGPTIVYDGRSELDKILNLLPVFFRFSVENLIDLFPTEIYGEEGPTGPKEKDNWFGDERW